MTPEPVLHGARVTLRPLQAGDAEALHPLYADAEAMRWWTHGPLATLDETRAKLAGILANPDWRRWAVTRRGDDIAIGTLGAHELRQGRVFEIGYSLVRTNWGGGLATEAVARLLDRLFGEDGARRVFADIDPDNTPSHRLLERLGFVREGLLRAHWETHIGVRDSLVWGLLAEEWPQRRPT